MQISDFRFDFRLKDSFMKTTIRLLAGLGLTLAIAGSMTAFGTAQAPRFFDDDPLWVEHDTENASSMKPLEVDLTVDLTYNIIKGRDTVAATRARNVNTVDEVADSSWFTNRAGHRPLTAEEVFRGPDTDNGPASGTWTVTSSKSDGVTPGFTVKDSSGQRWFLKFDPPGYRGMACQPAPPHRMRDCSKAVALNLQRPFAATRIAATAMSRNEFTDTCERC